MTTPPPATTHAILDELTPLLKQIDDAADRAFNDFLAAAGEAAPAQVMNERLMAAGQAANDAVPAEQRTRAAALTLALCDAYLAASDEDRRQARDRVRDALTFHHHLIGFILHAAAQVTRAAAGGGGGGGAGAAGAGGPGAATGETTDAQSWLRRGLAAASIENNVLDPRNTAAALSELHAAAQRSGIDPAPAFAAVAAMSGDAGVNPELPPMRVFLADFTRTAFFGANVESNLN